MRNPTQLLWLFSAIASASAPVHWAAPANDPDQWRSQHRIIDLHQHISSSEEHLSRAVKIMNEVGVGIGVNLSGGYVTRQDERPSAFERNKQTVDRLFPDRFVLYMNLDYSGWDDPGFSERAVQQIDEGHRLGAAGLKEYKRLGLYLRDKEGALIRIDDPKLDPVWKRCGELGMPISIHVADPKAFWLPYNESNERWEELKDHPNWWFGDPAKFPPHEELLAALNRVIERHPKTTFVCLHFANNPEDLDWVEASLDRYPNMMADLAARVPEIGRHDPEKVRRLFLKHQDRILFATDFQVYDRLTLGSGGRGPAPTNADAVEFFKKHWRWLETNDRNFEHMTPIQGNWTISGIGLPPSALRKIYFDNARQLLARSLPAPKLNASRTRDSMTVDGVLDERSWKEAQPGWLEYQSLDSKARPDLSTRVLALWTETDLYLAFEGPYTELTTFEPAQFEKERLGLWDRDVVEAFVAPDPAAPNTYYEFEIAPTSETLDVRIAPGEKEFTWNSGFQAKSEIHPASKTWTVEVRIPVKSLTHAKLAPGTIWKVNFYRAAKANRAYLAWNPTLRRTFHAPDRFGMLQFIE